MPTSTAERFRAPEYHHFAIARRWMLFDPAALTVLDSCAADGAILARARDGATRRELTECAVAAGLTPAEARARIRLLRRHRFLLAPGEEPHLAELAEGATTVTFMINVAQRCNLTCSYCYVNRGQFDYPDMPAARMSTDTADHLVDRLYELFPGFATYAYHFYGGEPLLNFDAIELITSRGRARAYATATTADFNITTNGTLMTRDVADFFADNGFTVYLSIDGDEAVHDAVRRYADGRGSYRDVERNLAYLRTKNVHIIGSAVIHDGLTLGDAMTLLREHGADQCKAERVHLDDADPLALHDEEHARYLADLEGLVEHYVSSLSAGRKPMDYRLSSKILALFAQRRRDFFCSAAQRMFGITADGEIYPCALHTGRPQSLLGHLGSGIDADRQRAFRDRFGSALRDGCRICWNRNLCGGGCSAMTDRFGSDDCRSLCTETEAAIAVFQRIRETEPALFFALVSPALARWAAGGDA